MPSRGDTIRAGHPGSDAMRRIYKPFNFCPDPKHNPGPDDGSPQAYILRLLA